MRKIKPTKAAKEEAKKHPDGWVYVLDEAFEEEENVPSEAIKGAWKVNSKGKIVGSFIPNPNYIELKKL